GRHPHLGRSTAVPTSTRARQAAKHAAVVGKKPAVRGRSWFGVGRFRSGVAIAVLAGGLVVAGAPQALAVAAGAPQALAPSPTLDTPAPAQIQTPAVTIAARGRSAGRSGPASTATASSG